MQLNSVVLPDPFGPIKPQIWLRPTSKETPLSATTPPKRTATSRTLSKGDGSAAGIRYIVGSKQVTMARKHFVDLFGACDLRPRRANQGRRAGRLSREAGQRRGW